MNARVILDIYLKESRIIINEIVEKKNLKFKAWFLERDILYHFIIHKLNDETQIL